MSSRPTVRNRFMLLSDFALILVSVLGSFALRLDVSLAGGRGQEEDNDLE